MDGEADLIPIPPIPIGVNTLLAEATPVVTMRAAIQIMTLLLNL